MKKGDLERRTIRLEDRGAMYVPKAAQRKVA